MSKQPRISVIIVTFNGMKWLSRCLSDLKKSTIPTTIIIVDNGSTDETCKYIVENYPDINLYKQDTNLGFGQANNFGINRAIEVGCDYVFLLNQDAYVYPDMFENMIKVIEKNKIVFGIASPLQMHPNGKWLEAHFEAYIRNTNIINNLHVGGEDFYYVDGVQAAGWLLPVSTFKIIGGFNPMFFHYGEDENYFQRAKYHGLRSIVIPSAKMIHDHVDYGKRKFENHDKIFRMLKSQSFLNINKRPFNILMDCTKFFSRGVYHFFKYHENDAICETTAAIVKNILNLKEYVENRKIAKQIGSHWL